MTQGKLGWKKSQYSLLKSSLSSLRILSFTGSPDLIRTVLVITRLTRSQTGLLHPATVGFRPVRQEAHNVLSKTNRNTARIRPVIGRKWNGIGNGLKRSGPPSVGPVPSFNLEEPHSSWFLSYRPSLREETVTVTFFQVRS
jgi:hypothetical protein